MIVKATIYVTSYTKQIQFVNCLYIMQLELEILQTSDKFYIPNLRLVSVSEIFKCAEIFQYIIPDEIKAVK